MKSTVQSNFDDLLFTLWTDSVRKGARTIERVCKDLEWGLITLRDHEEEAIVDVGEQKLRDSVDDLLEAYSLIEVAALVGYIPAQLPKSFAAECLRNLSAEALQTYYEKHYPLKLPTALRLRLEGASIPSEVFDEAEDAFRRVFDIWDELRRNDFVIDLQTLLDDYIIDGCDWEDLSELLSDPKKFLTYVLEHSPDDDILSSAALGFRDFLEFCEEFHALWKTLSHRPLIASASWHLFSYWFDQLDDKLGDVIKRALTGVELLTNEGSDVELREVNIGRIRQQREMVKELADPRNGRVLVDKIRLSQETLTATLRRRTAHRQVVERRGILEEPKLSPKKKSAFPNGDHIKKVISIGRGKVDKAGQSSGAKTALTGPRMSTGNKINEGPAFADWTERLKVYNDFIRALGEYKKAEAEAELKAAEAAQERERARAMQIVIRQLDRDLRGLNILVSKNNRAISQINDRQRSVQQLLRGRRISTFSTAWSAYLWFEANALIESGNALFAIEVTDAARSSSNFIDNRNSGKSIEDFPSDQKRALQLASWLREKQYMTRSGSDAQMALMQLFAGINDVASATVGRLQEQIKEIRQHTYDAWKPVTIVGIPAASRAAKIEQAGTRA